MIPEIGSFAIILALCFALLQSLRIAKLNVTCVSAQLFFLGIAMLCLIISFLQNDMTVLYVRDHSHQLLPFIYRVGAAWGGHEGSLLLWCLILAGWSTVYCLFSYKSLPAKTFTLILQILGVVSAGFIAFLFFTSNPFKRDFPTNLVVGDDLTPVLQDPGLIFHPPMLYLGYVGFALAFAFAIAALIEGRFDKAWVRALRPWVILPWGFLSCGIVLGSWWAYRELGWGGWWFWDPVENASLLPWLAATALLHALLVSEKRDVFKGWTLLLAIITFALSLLGTFLVRSGVLVSVHAFASDPTRGIFLLAYLAFLIGGAFLLYGARIRHFFQAPNFALLSRETFLLVNTIFLLTAVATICLGTLYPIILDALGLAKISVGEPYFNIVFLPIILPTLLLMGFAPHVNWNHQSFSLLIKKLGMVFLLSLLIGLITPKLFGYSFQWLASLGIFFAVWIILATLKFMWKNPIRKQHWPMIVAHIGIAVMALGITLSKSYSEDKQIKLAPGEAVTIAGHNFIFKNLAETEGDNFKSIEASFAVTRGHHSPQLLIAQQRVYLSHDQTLSKPGILANVWRDLYLALGSPLDDNAWSIRIYYKPFVRWIWAGGFLLLIGGLLSLLSYRKSEVKT